MTIFVSILSIYQIFIKDVKIYIHIYTLLTFQPRHKTELDISFKFDNELCNKQRYT